MKNYEKLMELKTKLITILELEVELTKRQIDLEQEIKKLEREK